MSISSNNFLEEQERLFFQEKAYINAEQAERERKLWEWLNEDDLVMLEDEKKIIYQNNEQINQQICLQH